MNENRTEQSRLAAIVFTDIVGSTQLKAELGDREAGALIRRHHALIREILSSFSEGEEIETAGDSFLILFAKPSDAVKFGLLVQSKLRMLAQEAQAVHDRIGIHMGEVLIEESDASNEPKALSGIHVDTCARVLSLAQANQILMTRFVFDNARSVLRGEEIAGLGELRWMNHGPYVPKGVEEPMEICEVGEVSAAILKPPPDSEKVHRYVSADSEPVLGWRPALGQGVPGTSWVLEEKLGEGGFGEVWLGQHKTTKQRRVFKFCFRADRVRSLKREVTLFRLMKERLGEHPHIVGVQDVYLEEAPYYLTMEYVAGRDLKTWSEERGGMGAIPLEVRLEIVAQVADALQAAHDAGVIHRDVKPSNILIQSSSRGHEAHFSKSEIINHKSKIESEPPHVGCYDVEAKLTDFGIGQVVSQEALAGITRAGFTQTMFSPGSSSQTGTHLYMAPELIAGEPASSRSDIYSLGVVLYQLLVGDFARPLTTDWSKRISDPLLREDLEKCFAGDPEERFASAGELATNIRALEKRRSEVAQRQAAVAARETTARRRKRLWQATVGFSMVLVVAAILVYAFKSTRPAVPISKPILVLPFNNDSPEKGDSYLAASLTGEFINRLKRVRGLKPKRIPQSMAGARIEDIRMALANQFNEPAIFEGSIQKSGEQLRMTARLVNAMDGQLLWTNTTTTSRKGVLTLPGDLVRAVTSALKIPLTAAERQQMSNAPTQNPEAYDAYLRGKFHLPFIDETNNRSAIATLERAVSLDTNFALAHAELGRAYVDRLSYLRPMESEWELKAKRAIAIALSLNPNLAGAHFSRGYLLWTPSQRYQHKPAIQALQTALDLDPQSEEADWLLNLIYNHVGLLDQCRQLAERAIVVNPLDPRGYWTKGLALAFQGEYQAALDTLGIIKGEYGNPELGYWMKAWAHFQLGKTNEASAIIDDFLGKNPGNYGGLFTSLRAMLSAKAGDFEKVEQQIATAIEQKERFVHFHHTSYQIASAYALMNKPDRAIPWFKESINDGWNCYPFFLKDHNLDQLRGIPDFQALMAKEKEKYDHYKDKFGMRSPPRDHK